MARRALEELSRVVLGGHLREIEAIINEGLKNPQQWGESMTPSALIIGLPNVPIISCQDTMRRPLFLESMRQQLAQRILHPELVRRLICPLKGQRRRCCGFGHYLQGIWASIPDEGKSKLRAPSKACLKWAVLATT
jgi:hypothetical protein